MAKKKTAVKKAPGKLMKKAAGTAAPKPAAPAPAPPQVRVRMYRVGLGDCFQLTFQVPGGERNVLIDFGTLGNKANNQVKNADVADAIVAGLPNGKMDLVVATHEHWDHLSGFNTDAMQQLAGKVDHVWLAWTENPADLEAKSIIKYKQDLGTALAAVVQAAPLQTVTQNVASLLGFAAGDVLLGAGKFAEKVNETMEFVRRGLGAKTEYLEPGVVLEPDWLPGFRFYILGPPRKYKVTGANPLNDLGEHGSSELYGLAEGIRAASLFHLEGDLSLLSDPAEAWTEQDPRLPFDRSSSHFSRREMAIQYPEYYEETESWRRIDDDWLMTAADLALQLDNATNNTSLAMAIERIADGKVLLFPADAQQGNWLSWDKYEWAVKTAAGAEQKVSAAELLNRTVFYKVGHHASHNATAKDRGLERMVNEQELTAFIPVDRGVALMRNPPGSWQMPARLLYRRLLEKTQGRVARSDLGWVVDQASLTKEQQATESEFASLADNTEWDRWKKSQQAATHVAIHPQYIDYVLQ